MGYALVICEKPDAARRIARALGSATDRGPAGIPVLEVKSDKGHFVVCSASGHLFGLASAAGYSGIFPVFDLEWVVAAKSNPRAPRIVKVISKLAEGASSFIHACDYDQEGEVIGYTLLEIACGGRYAGCMRAKFSTLTDEEIRGAFDSLEKPNARFAEAGRSRHLLDFVYGVNLSRALVAAFRSSDKGAYRNLSIGRVQGPALSFVADREVEINLHVPDPYWSVEVDFETPSGLLHARYKEPRLSKVAAEKVLAECSGKQGTVTGLYSKETAIYPPHPFNIGDLQKEAYRVFRLSPGYTLAIAEKLYLAALISYPRTSSQKLPPSIGYRKIIEKLQAMSAYASLSSALLSKPALTPNQGASSDPAHPAIYPTGQIPRNLSGLEFKVFDLIVKRFFATFGDRGFERITSVSISVGDHEFVAEGRTTTHQGWMSLYKPYAALQHASIPEVQKGQQLTNESVVVEEKFSQPPYRYSQASLLSKMEHEGIGTKATRAEIIATLLKRGYMLSTRGYLEATPLGLSVIDSMRKYVPVIVSTGLTKSMESDLEKVEEGRLKASDVIQNSVEQLITALALFRQKKLEIGRGVRGSVEAGSAGQPRMVVGACPVCKSGSLTIIKSRSSGKRFLGCTNYSSGCKASAPLPQRGLAISAGVTCKECGWPKLKIRFARRAKPWVICANVQCPSKKKGEAPLNAGPQK